MASIICRRRSLWCAILLWLSWCREGMPQSDDGGTSTYHPCRDRSRIRTSQTLPQSKNMFSDNGFFFLRCQPDGNVVVYNCGRKAQYVVLRRGMPSSCSFTLNQTGSLELVSHASSSRPDAESVITIARPQHVSMLARGVVDHLRLEDDGTIVAYARDANQYKTGNRWVPLHTFGHRSVPYSNRSCHACLKQRHFIRSVSVISDRLEPRWSNALAVCDKLRLPCVHEPAIKVNTSLAAACVRPNALSRGELGADLAHRRILARIVGGRDDAPPSAGETPGDADEERSVVMYPAWHLIFEDDIEMPDATIEAVRRAIVNHLLDAHDRLANVAHLGFCPGRNGLIKCAHAYAVTRQGAKELLRQIPACSPNGPVDTILAIGCKTGALRCAPVPADLPNSATSRFNGILKQHRRTAGYESMVPKGKGRQADPNAVFRSVYEQSDFHAPQFDQRHDVISA